MKKYILLVAFITSPCLGQTVQQSGTVTSGHPTSWTTSGVVQDGGPATNGNLTELGVTKDGGYGICVQDTKTHSGPYHQLCLSMTSGGVGSIYANGYNGGSISSFNIVINGTVYTFPQTVSQYLAGRTPPVTSTTTLTANDGVVPCDSTAGNVRIIAPPGLGTATNIKRVRIEKVSTDTHWCSISQDGVTDFAYVITPNDAGGGGWLDVEMNGATDRVFGVP